mmetsp:Transcript_7575/g.22222  ORF Transcript_7575/g.22222 Transcript_7575/m.22222 type:complete len:310 (+) Transcript_7575:602-1531(+)
MLGIGGRIGRTLPAPSVQQFPHVVGIHVRADPNVHGKLGRGGDAVVHEIAVPGLDSRLDGRNVEAGHVPQRHPGPRLILRQPSALGGHGVGAVGMIRLRTRSVQRVPLTLAEGQRLVGQFHELLHGGVIDEAGSVSGGSRRLHVDPPREAFAVEDAVRVGFGGQPLVEGQGDAREGFVQGGGEERGHSRSAHLLVGDEGEVDRAFGGKVRPERVELPDGLDVLDTNAFHILRPPPVNLPVIPPSLERFDRPSSSLVLLLPLRGNHVVVTVEQKDRQTVVLPPPSRRHHGRVIGSLFETTDLVEGRDGFQ